MNRDSARDFINQQEPTFLQATRKGYICPVCNQGANKGNGITRATGRPHLWHCVSCQKERSVLGLFASYAGITDDSAHYPEILERAAAYYGISLDAGADHRHSSPQEDFREYQNQPKNERNTHNSIHTNTDTQQQDFTTFYREAAAHLQETDYPQRRGLSLDTCKRYQIGYIAEWRHPKAPKAPSSPRLIIPVTPYSYLARDTRAELTKEQEENKKQLCKGKESVSWTWNREALRTATKPIFVVEGALDALSIIEAGGEAIALSSTAYINKFVRELKEDNAAPAQPFIIALDNDHAGNAAAEKLEAELTALHVPFYRYNPAGEHKDANERLQKDPAGLAAAVAQGESMIAEEIKEQEQEREKEYFLKNNAACNLQAFIDGITESVNTPYIPTGFPKLDAALDGGLFEGLYICGAISSLGKTTLLTQIGDQIAQQGHDVLIFSLEMARAELMAKSISRHTLLEVLDSGGNMRDAKTTRGITTGSRYANYSHTERELINTAINAYCDYAERIFILEGIGDIGAQQIREAVQEHVSITGNTPVIIADYLQILAPADPRSTDKQNTDKAVLELKRLSRDYKTPVIAISSFNRMNYKEAVTMEAFKESGAIEYSADVLIGLQLAGAGGKDFDATKEKAKNPREVELVILKNRNGRTGDKIAYSYYPLFNYFRER